MPLKLTDELRKALPEPDSGGVVRATVALKVEGDEVRVLEINDTPVSYVKEKSRKTDDEEPMRPDEMPDLYAVENAIR